jgi:uncharacterized cupin superfamily protein
MAPQKRLEETVPEQIVFSAPANVELAADPIHPHWIIEGTPQARSRRLAQSADGTSSVMAWSCTAGRFKWHYTVDEALHIISGEVFVTDDNGQTRRLGPGDMVFFPAGTSSLWHVPVEVRKIAFCRHSMPRPFGTLLRAWNKLRARFSGVSLMFADVPEPQPAGRPAAAVKRDRAIAQ